MAHNSLPHFRELKYAAVTKKVQEIWQNVLHRKEDSNDKESIQSNTTRYSRHHKEMWQQHKLAKLDSKWLHNQYPNEYKTLVVNPKLEFEWNLYIEAKKKEIRGEAWQFNDSAICFVNGQLQGGPQQFIDWAAETYKYEDYRPPALYQTLTEEAYKTCLNKQNHDYVYMDISIGDEAAGRLVFELFTDVVPKTCENFKALITGEKGKSPLSDYNLHYLNSLFHRIVRNGWIQGGDIYHGRGNGGESIFGTVFEDENFAMKHTRRGILGMANKGRHTNGSQFYITLQPAQWMSTKYVAFGQVIEGTETLKKMEEQQTMNERPNQDIKVTDCGVCKYEF